MQHNHVEQGFFEGKYKRGRPIVRKGKQSLFCFWRKSDVMTITEDIFFDALISAFKSKWIESERLLHDPTFKNFAIDEIWKEQIV